MRHASAVILVRKTPTFPEFLFIKRSSKGPFPNIYAFPGGTVDEKDRALSREWNCDLSRATAARELKEECGIDFSKKYLQNEFKLWSNWITPTHEPKRFNTLFYLKVLKAPVTVLIDNHEVVDYRWMTSHKAIDDHLSGDIKMYPPQFYMMHEFQKMGIDDLERNLDFQIQEMLPLLISDNPRFLALPGDSKHPQKGTSRIAKVSETHRIILENRNDGFIKASKLVID